MPMPEVFGVRLDNISDSIEEIDIRRCFGAVFEIYSVIFSEKKHHAYVNFLSESDAKSAVKRFNNEILMGSRMRVSIAPKKDFKKVTDCKFGDLCSKSDSCPYRHNIVEDEICQDWAIRPERCSKSKCKYRHPPRATDKEDSEEILSPKTPKTPIDSLRQYLENKCECSICLDRMVDAKTLKCQHSFCKDCLNDTVTIDKENNNIVSFSCPNCREITQLPLGQTLDDLKCELGLRNDLGNLNQKYPEEIQIEKCSSKTCKNGIPDRACMKCSVLLCSKECLLAHFKEGICKGDNIVPVKHSKGEGTYPFCEDHKCFSKFYCQNCFTYLCVYCKYRACSTANITLPEHNCIGLSQFSSNLDADFQLFQDKAEKVKSSCQVTKGKITMAVNEKIPELKTSIDNLKYKILSTTWLTLNKVEEELCAKISESCTQYKKENNLTLNNAKKISSQTKKISECGPGFAKLLNYQKVRKLADDLDGDIEDDFSVHLETPKDSFEEDLYKMIDFSIGKITLSMNTNDTTEILPHSNVVKNSSDLVQMQSEDSVGDSNTYKRSFLKLASELLTPQPGNTKKNKKKKKSEEENANEAVDEEQKVSNEADSKKTRKRRSKKVKEENLDLINLSSDDNENSFLEMVGTVKPTTIDEEDEEEEEKENYPDSTSSECSDISSVSTSTNNDVESGTSDRRNSRRSSGQRNNRGRGGNSNSRSRGTGDGRGRGSSNARGRGSRLRDNGNQENRNGRNDRENTEQRNISNNYRGNNRGNSRGRGGGNRGRGISGGILSRPSGVYQRPSSAFSMPSLDHLFLGDN